MPTENKKKILYVITKSNFGGAQRNVFELATGLPKDSYEVLVAFGGNGLLKEKLETEGIATHTIQSFERDFGIKKDLQAFREVFGLIREFKPDVVHCHSSKAGGIGVLAARLCRIPRIVFTAHGWPFYEERNFVWKIGIWILSWMTALLAHAVILVSNHDLARLHMPCVQKKCRVIHTGVGEIAFTEREMTRALLIPESECMRHIRDLWLVTIAEHTPNKNLFAVIKAVTAFNKSTHGQKIFYTIIGDGELLNELTTYTEIHALTDSINLVGFIDDARSYLKAFDAFILPSLKEGLPYALLEAGIAGLPTIASNVGGIPEIIQHNKTGLLIDPHDTYSIRNALTLFVEKPQAREKLAHSLTVHVTKRFGLEAMQTKTIALYNQY